MLTTTGEIFHIDFGHILGNYKSKFGIKRERPAFVLTEQHVAIMGDFESDRWKLFLRRCNAAFLILRRNANLFINLLNMTVGIGIPEILDTRDIEYLTTALCLDFTDEEASKHFEHLIYESLKVKTFVNSCIHLIHHK